MKRISRFIWIVLIFSQYCYAQDNNLKSHIRTIINFPDLNKELKREYIKGYVQPFVTAYGSAIGGALFYRADTKTFPKLDIGLSGTYVEIPTNRKTFSFNNNQVPTFFGLQNYSGDYVQGGGLSKVILPYLQLNLGVSTDFEMMFRGIKANLNKEVGNITLIGFGIKYGLSDLVSSNKFPVDMSVQAVYHTFSIDKWLDAGNFGMNIQFSKKLILPSLNLYTGIGFESTSMTIKTEEIDPINEIGNISVDGENKFRMNLGLSWTFWLLNIHTDYNIGEINSFGSGIMIVL